MNIYEMFLVRAKKYALAEISSGKGMTASFLLRFHILQKFRAYLSLTNGVKPCDEKTFGHRRAKRAHSNRPLQAPYRFRR